jgi:anti-sigma factor RsiW
MNDPFFNRLCEAARRRDLTASEQAELRAWLEQHPEAHADWEAERQLNSALGRLPDVPVATNFTARVLQEIERDAAVVTRPGAGWSWRRLFPRAAFAAVGALALVAAIALGFRQRERIEARRMAQSVVVVSAVSALPSPEALQDFDAILQLSPGPRPDTALLALLE